MLARSVGFLQILDTLSKLFLYLLLVFGLFFFAVVLLSAGALLSGCFSGVFLRGATKNGTFLVSPLCTRCYNVLSSSRLWRSNSPIEDWEEWHDFHMSVSISYSISAQCQLCTIVVATLENKKKNKTRANDPRQPLLAESHRTYSTLTRKEPLDQDAKLHIFTQGNTKFLQFKSTLSETQVFEIHEGLGDVALRPSQRRSTSTESSEVISTAKKWIERCSREHVECSHMSSFRPKRLLRILTPDMMQLLSQERNPELRGPNIKYLALSHCWGTSGIDRRLTKSTEQELSAWFRVRSLPQNFRDAISITHSLGYHYIWIDSLCIMQDDEADWEAQSGAMSDIFASAECTIAATSSKHAQGGCFRFRDSFLSTDCILMGTNHRYMYVSPRIPDQHLSLGELFQKKVDRAPLNDRAWTFQERLLSRRILHYGEGVVLFECNAMHASEWEPYGQPYRRKEYVRHDGKVYSGKELQTLRTVSVSRIIKQPFYEYVHPNGRMRITKKIRNIANPKYIAIERQKNMLISQSARFGQRGALDMLQSMPAAGLSQAEMIECHNRWYELVHTYSRRSITFRKDRLVALAGLARIISKKNKMESIAGMWVTTLPLDLLWKSSGPLGARSGEYVAPSWAWASADGGVDSLLSNHEMKSGLGSNAESAIDFQIRVEAVAHDPTLHGDISAETRLKAGSIVLEGMVKEFDPGEAQSQPDFLPDFLPSQLHNERLVVLAGYTRGGTDLSYWGALVLKHVIVPEIDHDMYERIGCMTGLGSAPWTHEHGWITRRITII